jgi:hypothetical protein
MFLKLPRFRNESVNFGMSKNKGLFEVFFTLF